MAKSAGNFSMQVDTDDDGHTPPEQYCELCLKRLHLEQSTAFGSNELELMKEEIRVMKQHTSRREFTQAARRTPRRQVSLRHNSRGRRVSGIPFITVMVWQVSRHTQATKSPSKIIETKNAFESLDDETENSDENGQILVEPEQVPPITSRYNDDYLKILADIHKVCGPTGNKFTNGLVKIFPGTKQNHQEIGNYCRTQGYDFHVINSASKGPLKVVIKNLPPRHDPENIKSYLKDKLKFPVERVIQLAKLGTRQPLPFFL
ncbi:hypothetical protein AVEN_161584-1 [Araneus ventricosus]|uniref:Pre-C2HC domain-containing protein n=1 Tax=Araneus ventricosus TaxID=182803 RepID=A0A4Y2FI64_ARAVE|nr:hypothetical protein AVEN_161584-1 [Araneus ventricosus]